jgi:membrane protein
MHEDASVLKTDDHSRADPRPTAVGESAGGQERREDPTGAPDQEKRRLPDWLRTLIAFWFKINHDWVFNLAGLLAYNFLMTVFPILLLLLAGTGVVIGNLSPSAEQAFERWVAAVFPGEVGQVIVSGIVDTLTQSVSLLLLVGLIGAFLAGSRLFITLENCFGVVFRLRGRGPVTQNLMAAGMLLVYLVLVPVVFLGSLIPSLVSALWPNQAHIAGTHWLFAAADPAISLAVTTLAVGVIYVFVPHRPVHWRTWREVWRGAVAAALLLLAYEAFFPWYRENFVHVSNYGSVGAFIIVILLFFYYLSVILLLGAEINSWAAGQRGTAADIPGVLHAIQAHRTLQGAVGPTAGEPQEELQLHRPSRLRTWALMLADRWPVIPWSKQKTNAHG